MKNKYFIGIITSLLLNESFATLIVDSPKYDLSNKLNKKFDFRNSLTLTDVNKLENQWAKKYNNLFNISSTHELKNPIRFFLDQVVSYSRDFTLITKCLISDHAEVLGSLDPQIKTWHIGYDNTYTDDDAGSGQTASRLPASVKTIVVLEGAVLSVSPFRPLRLHSDQELRVEGSLIVQRNAMLFIENDDLFSRLTERVYIYGTLYTKLTTLENLKINLFYSESSIATENVILDDSNGVGKIRLDIAWMILGGTSSAPQYASKLSSGNVDVQGYLTADSSHQINNVFTKIIVSNGGTLKDINNNINIYQVTVKDKGVLHISKGNSSTLAYNPAYKVIIESGGTIKFDSDVAISSAISENQITIKPGAIVDFNGIWSRLNTKYTQMRTDFQNYPITLQTNSPFDLSRDDNCAVLKYNHWNIGSGGQVFLNNNTNYMAKLKNKTIKILPNVNLTNDITLLRGQTLNRDNTASITGRVSVMSLATLIAGSKNFHRINASDLKIFSYGRLVINSILDESTSLVKVTHLTDWPDFKKIAFDELSSLYTFSLLPDTENYVGSIMNSWHIAKNNQTAYFNRGDIKEICLLPNTKFLSVNLAMAHLFPTLSRSNVDTSLYSFTIYKNQTFKMGETSEFHMLPGSKTLIQRGANIISNNASVSVFNEAVLETDGHGFSSTFIQSGWFKEGSTFNTLDVFFDSDKILYHVLWNIFSTKNPHENLEYQEIYMATPKISRIVIKPGAYVGVSKFTSVLLYNELIIEPGGKLEVLEDGEFSFVGGTLTIKNPLDRILVNYGARLTLASNRYSLEDVLRFVQLDNGAILSFGDAYEPGTTTTSPYPGFAYTLDDDKYGLGLIPEHVSVEFNNGVQTLLNVSKRMRLISFKNQGILAVKRDYPLSLYSGQVLDLNESDFDTPFSTDSENRYPYRMFIRSGATLFLQAGARIVDTYTNKYTVLGVKAPIKIKTDAEIMNDIPGINRWIWAIKSTVGAVTLNTLDDVMLDLFKDSHSDMNEFTTAITGRLNVGGNLELTTTNTVFDNFAGVGSIPFFTWNVGSKNSIYDQGQTISRLRDASINPNDVIGTSAFLKIINILDGAYVFSISNYELDIGKCKVYNSDILQDRQLKILKGGTLFISEDSSNAKVNNLYVCAGANLIIDGKLNVANVANCIIEVGANVSGSGKIIIENTQYSIGSYDARARVESPSYQRHEVRFQREIDTTYDYEYQGRFTSASHEGQISFDNPNFSNADYHIIEIVRNGHITFKENVHIVNNENAIINILNEGILEINMRAKVKNLGDISALKGGKIISNGTFFNNDNVLQSWFEEDSIFQTLADFDDGIGGIQSIPENIEWEINADQTTSMGYFPPKKVTVFSNKRLILGPAFIIAPYQTFIIMGYLTLNANLSVVGGGKMDVTNLQGISGNGNITLNALAMLINPNTNVASRCTALTGSIIKNTIVWNSFPTLHVNSSNAEWQIATSASQTVSSFPVYVKTIKILSGAMAQINLSSIPVDKILILENGSICTFNSDLTVNGNLILYKGANFGSPTITVPEHGVLTVNGQMPGLDNVKISGGKLVGIGIIEDSVGSILSQVDNGETFEIG